MARLSTFCIVAAVFLAATCALAVHVDVSALATTARRARHHHAAAMLGASRGKVHKKFTTDACKNFARFSSVTMRKEVEDEIVALHWTLDATPTTVQTAEAKSTFRLALRRRDRNRVCACHGYVRGCRAARVEHVHCRCADPGPMYIL